MVLTVAGDRIVPERNAVGVVCIVGSIMRDRGAIQSSQIDFHGIAELTGCPTMACLVQTSRDSLLSYGPSAPSAAYTTPKGCTIEGLNEMEHKGLSSSLIQGMVASFNKINNIKKEQI